MSCSTQQLHLVISFLNIVRLHSEIMRDVRKCYFSTGSSNNTINVVLSETDFFLNDKGQSAKYSELIRNKSVNGKMPKVMFKCVRHRMSQRKLYVYESCVFMCLCVLVCLSNRKQRRHVE